ncbi:hypothetical protein [Streptomyces sp. NPDC088923]|uniref:hypothetical protein n=1 Tax=Streptomyces sp. NPDC088923 TaxID=3365913 RepID=UPI00382122BF
MGSMRNPVGPLPSSIYWRRRAIFGAVLVLVALLVVWLVNVTGGGGGGNKDGAQGSGGSSGPAPSITPGPSGSGPAISQQPGGRDESGGSDKDDDTATPGDGASDGDADSGSGKDGSGKGGSADGADEADGSNEAGGEGGSGSGGSGKGAGAGSSDAQQVPAGSSLPDCATGVAELSLRSEHNTYEPGKKPQLELSVKNSSAAACKVNLGAARTVVTITLTGEDAPYWSSKDCPATESLWLRVPAKETIRYEIEWNRKASRAACAKPPSGSAKPGTYLVEATAPGLEKARTSFRLDKD